MITTTPLWLRMFRRNIVSYHKTNRDPLQIGNNVVAAPRPIRQNSTRSEQENINDDVNFTVEIIQLYKEEDDVQYGEELTFVTGGNSGLCGVDLAVGEEYLIDLYPSSNDDQLYAQLCGMFRTWSSVTDEEATELESCDYDQSCDLTCGEFQVRPSTPSMMHQVLHLLDGVLVCVVA